MVNKIPLIVIALVQATFLIAIILHHVFSGEASEELEQHPLFPEYSQLMMMFIALYFAYFVHGFLEYYNMPCPYGAFIIIGGFLWGMFSYYDSLVRLSSFIIHLPATELMYIYIPVTVFNTAFCTDVPLFLKDFSQILSIGTLVAFFTAVVFGCLSPFFINSSWQLVTGIIFGLFSIPTHPYSVVRVLKKQSTKTKQISVLLEGESLILFIVGEMTYKLVMHQLLGYVKHWHQFLAIVVRAAVLGFLFGFLMGYLGRFLIRHLYTNRLSVFIMCLSLPLLTYVVSDALVSGFGSTSVVIVGIIMGKERILLAKEIDTFLTKFWETAAFVIDVLMILKVSIMVAIEVTPLMPWPAYPLVFVNYFFFFMIRFVSFLVFSPLLSRIGYGMDLKTVIVCAWGGFKCTFSLLMVSAYVEHDLEISTARDFFFFLTSLYFLSMFINGTFTTAILDFLGFREISLAKQINMNSCLRQIYTKRRNTIEVLRDRIMADTNWSRVLEATNLKHPYRIKLDSEEDDGEFQGFKSTWCGDCKKEVPQEPTKQELNDMLTEAKLKVLKAKKMSYARQYENGMVSKEGIRILIQTIELSIDSEDKESKVIDLYKKFTHEGCFKRFVRKRAEHVAESKEKSLRKYRPPRTYWRRRCYHLVLTNRTFDIIMLLIITLHLPLLIIEMHYFPSIISNDLKEHSQELDYFFFFGNAFFVLIYWVEFVIKVMAYSWIHVCEHGFRYYFSSFWNIVDFIVILGGTTSLVTNAKNHFTNTWPSSATLSSTLYLTILDTIKLLRVVRLLRFFEIFYPDIIAWLERSTNTNMAFTYELGKSYITAETEVLDALPYMIPNAQILQETRQKIESDKVLITKVIGLVQKERPWIAITVKTTQAIRTILNSMNEAINQLKMAGWVDEYEHDKLILSMDELYKRVNSIKDVQPSPPKVIFKEVAWMAKDEDVIEYLFENVTARSFAPGDVVFREGMVADGILIVVTGLFAITYYPNPHVLHDLAAYGRLPIIDYFSATKYEEPAVDYIVSGNCIGELSTLTERCYNCVITAEAHSQVYFLSRGVLRRAMELSPDPVNGLECRIWKEVSVRIALPLLLSTPAYQATTQHQIKYALERSFVPDLSRYKVFAVTDMIQDIILIDGAVANYNTREMFKAPCCIPRNVQRLILPTSDLMIIPSDGTVKLLIIPNKDVDEYDVMITAEETCEMVSTGSSSRCLQHTVQDRVRRRRQKAGSKYRGSRGRSRTPAESIASSSYYGGSEGGSIYLKDQSEVGSVGPDLVWMEEEMKSKGNESV